MVLLVGVLSLVPEIFQEGLLCWCHFVKNQSGEGFAKDRLEARQTVAFVGKVLPSRGDFEDGRTCVQGPQI